MKIRTDFVTNSSSSSFVLEIYIELENGKNLSFAANGGSAESGIIDYFWDDATITVSPKQLGSAKSVQELIDLLKNGVYDGWVSHGDKLFENKSLYGQKRRHNPTHFISMIEEYVTSMDDIKRIVITGDESSGWRYQEPFYYRTYAYSPKTDEYTCAINGYEFEKNGSSGGDLIFKDADDAKQVDKIYPPYITITTKGYAIKKGKEAKQKMREAALSGDAEVQLGKAGIANELSKKYAREVSPVPETISINGKNFVHTSCSNEELIDKFVLSRGGEVRSSTVLVTDYLIIGNNIDHKTTKIDQALKLNASGKSIIAMTEYEFWTLASQAKHITVDDFDIEDNILKKYRGPGGDIVVPQSVVRIEKKAFCKCGGITSVSIPESVAEIATEAFAHCENLHSVILPKKLTHIEKSVFCGCKNLEDIVIPDTVDTIGCYAFEGCGKLKQIKLPNSITKFGNGAFLNCSGLTEISIPEGVQKLSDCLFKGCRNLSSVILPDTLMNIGNEVFNQCGSLVNINIPKGVKKIGSHVFKGCPALTGVTVDTVNAKYTVVDGILYNKSCTKLIAVLEEHRESFVLPNGVKIIEKNAFTSCEKLRSINIPDSVTSIGASAFSYCTSLASINIPDSVTSIGAFAFFKCTSLASINIPDSVTNIEKEAFWGCTSLASINIPDSVTSIGASAFSYCKSLASINIPDSVTNIEKEAFWGCERLKIIGTPGSYAESYAKENNIPFVAE